MMRGIFLGMALALPFWIAAYVLFDMTFILLGG